MVTYKIDLNFYAGAIPTVIHVSQYDSDVQLIFNIFDSKGTFDGASRSCKLVGTRPDRVKVSVNGTSSITSEPRTCTFTLTDSFTSVPGKTVLQIVLYQSSNIEKYSSKIFLIVEPITEVILP